MKREKVDSSIIYSIGFDKEKSILEVEFVDGAVFRYTDIPYREYLGLMDAGSHGKYFLRNIRDMYTAAMVEQGNGREEGWY